MKKQKLIGLTLATVSALALFTACASSDSKSEEKVEKQKIIIATDGATKPFTYTEGETTTGYDIEVARVVFENLEDYEIEVQVTDFATIIPGLDSNRYQMGANDYGWTAERDEKYYFSSPLSKSNNAIAVKIDDKEYSSLEDLAGKSTQVNSASNYSKVLNDYNAANPDKTIEIGYVSGQSPFVNRLTDTISGKSDFILYDQISLKQTIKDMGMEEQLKVQAIEASSADEAHDGYEYFLFPKTEEGQKLQEAVNAELKKLEADGTLQKLSEKYLGGDFVPEASEFK
ncbi:MAG: transporter substrate-binding domain-containing protein [Lactovum sp.]